MKRLVVIAFGLTVLWSSIPSTTALKCGPCDLSKCPKFDRCTCRFGVGKDVCNCCDKCYQGINDKCGGPFYIYGKCGNFLYCKFKKSDIKNPNKVGICKIIKKPGFKPELCSRVRCKAPTCSYGFYTAIVEYQNCCPVCYKGENECCRFRERCAIGLECIKGRCRKKARCDDECPFKLICPMVLCPLLRCIAGTGKARCQCCSTCLREERQSCGDTYGLCREGLWCKGGEGRSKGICLPLKKKCPYQMSCALVKCRHPKGCKFGCSKAPCQCYCTCRRDGGEDCGDSKGLCRSGYTCKYDNRQHKKVCVCDKGIKEECGIMKPCKLSDCPVLTYCPYGISTPKCSSCPACIVGPDSKCGNNIADCAPGLRCSGGICKLIGCKTPQNCKEQSPCFYFPTTCKHGVGHSECNCCADCVRGEGQTCSAKYPPCVDNLKCIGGICRKKYSPECPTPDSPFCRQQRALHPCKVFKCRYGISYPKCLCCRVCTRGPGQKCGPYIADCAKGLECVKGICKDNGFWKVPPPPKSLPVPLPIQLPVPLPRPLPIPPPRPVPIPPPSKCPCPNLNCNGVKCSEPKNCKYGYGAAPCKCCLYCLKGPNELCGKMAIPCGKGLACVRTSRSQLIYHCLNNRPTNCRPCPQVLCPALNVKLCRYGAGTDPCGCCPVCLKGINEKCGGTYEEYGRCSPAFVCQSQKAGEPGVCVCGEDYNVKTEL